VRRTSGGYRAITEGYDRAALTGCTGKLAARSEVLRFPDAVVSTKAGWSISEGHFRSAGTWNCRWRDKEINRLRSLVEGIRYWACDERDVTPCPLQLGQWQFGEADEAWIPVLTPDGPGVLLWSSSGGFSAPPIRHPAPGTRHPAPGTRHRSAFRVLR
jgi:Family of unknown function (DUF6210)